MKRGGSGYDVHVYTHVCVPPMDFEGGSVSEISWSVKEDFVCIGLG